MEDAGEPIKKLRKSEKRKLIDLVFGQDSEKSGKLLIEVPPCSQIARN